MAFLQLEINSKTQQNRVIKHKDVELNCILRMLNVAEAGAWGATEGGAGACPQNWIGFHIFG